jgi:threonine aldolase
MVRPVLDFRSDTATRPSPAMRQAMAEAPVGDDVFDEDPTINRLEETVAALLGKEAAIFVPSGTMSNQIGIRIHCKQGDEVICESNCHVYNYEQAGFAQLGGVVARTVPGVNGVLHVDQLRELIRPDNCHFVRTRLVSLENTHNRGGGKVWPYEQLADVCEWAHENGLATHLDGARLWNASIATGISMADWAKHFDTVSVCFSKGLGAPVGSALVGTKKHIAEADRHRKLFGGGMRQAGVIAAGALYGVENNFQRLAEDHFNAKRLADGIRQIPGLTLVPDEVDTNLVIFQIDPRLEPAGQFVTRLKEQGLIAGSFGRNNVRLVTHLDVNTADVDAALAILRRVCAADLRELPPSAAAKTAYA